MAGTKNIDKNSRNKREKLQATTVKLPSHVDDGVRLREIVRVRLMKSARIVYADTQGILCMPGQNVVVKVKQSLLLGTCLDHRSRRMMPVKMLASMSRIADNGDLRNYEDNAETEKLAFAYASEYAFANDLQMKLLMTELSLDGRIVTVHFASDVRIDFREMVTFLAKKLRIRIEMLQTGVRPGTGMACGTGACGRQLCCKQFLEHFDPIATKLIRAQGLAANPRRSSGMCGRLFCCLGYEYTDYMKTRKFLPKRNKRVLTRYGVGKISDIDVISEEITVKYDNGESERLTMNDMIVDPAPEDLPDEFPIMPKCFHLNGKAEPDCPSVPGKYIETTQARDKAYLRRTREKFDMPINAEVISKRMMPKIRGDRRRENDGAFSILHDPKAIKENAERHGSRKNDNAAETKREKKMKLPTSKYSHQDIREYRERVRQKEYAALAKENNDKDYALDGIENGGRRRQRRTRAKVAKTNGK